MIRSVLALLLLTNGLVRAVEGYDPRAHPAQVERTVTGYTTPIRMLDLAAEEAGRLTAVLLQPGERVSDGAVAVVRLDAEIAELAVTITSATLAARRREAEWHLQDQAHAEREAQRAETLFAEDRLAEQVRDAALRERDRTRGLAAIDAELVAAVSAELATATARRARRDLHAPAGWVVVERLREPGALVAPGEAILRLADVSELLVQLRLDEAELAALRAQTDTLTVRFASGDPVPARIRRVDVLYDPVGRKRLIELVVAGAAAPEASGGLAVAVDVSVPDPNGGVLVPLGLVEWRLERPVVRAADGSEFAVIPLRRTADALVIPATLLPPEVRLIAKP